MTDFEAFTWTSPLKAVGTEENFQHMIRFSKR